MIFQPARVSVVTLLFAALILSAVTTAGAADGERNGRIAFTRIAFDSGGETDLWSASGRGRKPGRLAKLPGSQASPAISPDGGTIAFWDDRAGGIDPEPGDTTSIAVIGADGESYRRVTGARPVGRDPGWTADGQTIVYPDTPRDDFEGSLLSVPSNATETNGTTFLDLFDANEGAPSFSPDGRRMAFVRHAPGGRSIWVANADGGDGRSITPTGAHIFSPDFAPDSRRIAFVRGGDIFTVRPNGEGLRRITRTAATENSPEYSPDGRRIAFERAGRRSGSGPADIWTVRADGSRPVQVTDRRSLPRRVDFESPAWLPR